MSVGKITYTYDLKHQLSGSFGIRVYVNGRCKSEEYGLPKSVSGSLRINNQIRVQVGDKLKFVKTEGKIFVKEIAVLSEVIVKAENLGQIYYPTIEKWK